MIRISQNMKFTNFISNMNMSMTKLMEMNIQSSSQKKVNKPSDDPVGAARILGYRDSLKALDSYKENIDTAKGWLGVADETLLQTNTVVTRLKELAEQASTGTLSADNREQISYEVRQLFGQLLNLSNTEYEGRHIFAGHKTNQPAFQEILGLTTNDSNIGGYALTGGTPATIVVQFLQSGDVGTTLNAQAGPHYRYSTDRGETWTTGTLAAGETTLDLGGVQLDLSGNPSVTAVDPDNLNDEDNGTWMWVRPAAEYLGDDKDQVQVDEFVADGGNIESYTKGSFSQDIMVRIVSNASPGDMLDGSGITYVYSLDGGSSWSSEKTATGDADSTSLVVPGGFLVLSNAGGGPATLSSGESFFIRPRKADIRFEISQGEYLTVNNIGKDVFGGSYRDPDTDALTPAFGGGEKNLFETVGELIAFLETNNQSGIQRCLDKLDTAAQHIMTQAAMVGGRENRLDVADNILSGQEIFQGERLSTIEDVDVAELMTKLAQQQIIYESVLKSSSMIMRMNLMNYV